ncbi:MAG: type 4a pilus biogenesis protein PilO [Desulfonatronovibrionaceae bacterium]
MAKRSLFEQLEQLTPLHRLLILFVSLGLVLGGGWYFLLSPKMDKAAGLEKDIRKLKKDIRENRKIADNLEEREKELKAKRQEFAYAKRLLPQDAQALERLLASFEKLGNDQGVEFILFKPGGGNKKDFYAQRSVQLQLEGTFYNLMRYFDRLSRLDRLVDLESVRFSPQGEKDAEKIILSADARLLVYRSLTPEEMEEDKKK